MNDWSTKMCVCVWGVRVCVRVSVKCFGSEKIGPLINHLLESKICCRSCNRENKQLIILKKYLSKKKKKIVEELLKCRSVYYNSSYAT